MISLLGPSLTFAVHEDGTLEVISGWFPMVAFPEDWLAAADGVRLVVRGDELEIRCTNGSATYALGPPGGASARLGRLIRSSGVGPRVGTPC